MKQIIRLTEGDLHNIVKESVNRVLKESYDDERYKKVYDFCNTKVNWKKHAHKLDNLNYFSALAKHIASCTNENYDFCYNVLRDYIDDNPDARGEEY